MTAWVSYRGATIDSVTVATTGEDTAVNDVYRFGAQRRLLRLVRSGHYINDRWATLIFVPTADGRLVLDARSGAIRRRMEAAGHESYWVDWPRYPNFKALPFDRLIRFTPNVAVREGCIRSIFGK